MKDVGYFSWLIFSYIKGDLNVTYTIPHLALEGVNCRSLLASHMFYICFYLLLTCTYLLFEPNPLVWVTLRLNILRPNEALSVMELCTNKDT